MLGSAYRFQACDFYDRFFKVEQLGLLRPLNEADKRISLDFVIEES